MSKKKILEIGLALQSIAVLVTDEDLKKIEKYLDKIEKAIADEDVTDA